MIEFLFKRILTAVILGTCMHCFTCLVFGYERLDISVFNTILLGWVLCDLYEIKKGGSQ